MKQIEKSPILITGAARSGTSMVAGVIDISGAFGGDMSGPNRNNQKGMFENSRIRNEIVKPHLRELGYDPKGQYPLPETEKLSIPVNWRKRVENIMIAQGYKEGPWFYKGAKMCLTWPIWHHAFPDAKWIIVRRRTADIVNSCMRTGFMNAFKDKDGWLWWVHEHEQRFREMIEAGLNVKIVWPEKMLYGNYHEMQETIEWLGLDWKGQKVYNFIEPKLWHAKRKKGIIKK